MALELRNTLPPVLCTVAPVEVLDIVVEWLSRVQVDHQMVEVRAGSRLVGVAGHPRLLSAVVLRAVGLVSAGL